MSLQSSCRFRGRQRASFTASAALGLIAAATGALASSVARDNGLVAHAYPVEEVTIDGEIDEWAEGLPEYVLDTFLVSVPAGDADLKATFQAAYPMEQQALVVAVTVADDTHIVDPAASVDIDTQDSCYLYLDAQHSSLGSRPLWFRATYDPERNQVSTVTGAEQGTDGVEVAVTRSESVTVYEWRVALEDEFELSKTIGLDVLVCDVDAMGEEAKYATWGPGGNKAEVAGRVGDVVIVDPSSFPGTLEGQVGWEREGIGPPPSMVCITSTKQPLLRLHVSAGATGRYRVELPAGEYQVAPAFGLSNPLSGDSEVEVLRVDPQAVVGVTVEGMQEVLAEPLLIPTFDAPPVAAGKEGILYGYEASQARVVDEFVEELMSYYEVPGASVALVKNGQVAYHKALGVKNRLTGEPVESTTLFEAASISKPVFAYGVMRLVERGEFDLDQPLHEILPFPHIADDERSKLITARMVLSHKTGLPNWGWGGAGGWRNGGPLQLFFEPGARFEYSGEGFDYLGRVIERLTGTGLEEWLQTEVAEPTGMQQAHFSANERLNAVVANGHWHRNVDFSDPAAEVSPASSMHTEAQDFARFMLALIEGRGLKPETYAEMLRPQTEIPPEKRVYDDSWPQSLGLGFFLRETPHGRLVEHGGNNGDFHCKFGVFPESGQGYAVFTNGNMGHKLVRALELLLIGGGG